MTTTQLRPVAAWEAQVERLVDAGDIRAAVTAVLRHLGPQILRYVRAVLRDLDDADDAFSRFAEGLWTSLGQFRRQCSLEAWAYRIAWHAALRVIQDPYRRRCHTLPTDAESRLPADARSRTSIERELRVSERVARLRQTLEPAEQTMIILRFERGLSWRDIARVLADEGAPVDEAALRKRFERLKLQLRKRAIAEGLLDG